MAEVFAWPPVFMTGYEHTIDRPMQRSEGLKGKAHFSQSEQTRRQVSASVAGIGRNGDSGAYIEALKILLDGKPPFVRMKLLPRFWFGALRGIPLVRGEVAVNWKSGDAVVNWFSDGVGVNWTAGGRIDGEAGTDQWNYLDCTGFTPDTVAAYPTERITVDGQTATVLRTARADATGAARIYLMSALPDGQVLVGLPQAAVFEIIQFPRSGQSLTGDYSYGFQFTEVFEEQYSDGFVEVDPWN